MPAKILVVDDNSANLDLMVYLLRSFGHDATGVPDAKDGLTAAMSGDYDVILSDILMPGLDGFELARRVKAGARTASTPLIAVTALAMVGDRDRVVAGGFDGYIPKPIDPQTFVTQVDAYLPQTRRSNLRKEERATKRDPRKEKSSGPLILAVDDVQVNLDVIHGALEPFGYRIVDARSVAEAMNKICTVRPALILCDVHMPEGDGYQFIQHVKKDPDLKSVPFVFLTSSARYPSQQAKGLALGATSFVMRPIDPSNLIDAVRQALSS